MKILSGDGNGMINTESHDTPKKKEFRALIRYQINRLSFGVFDSLLHMEVLDEINKIEGPNTTERAYEKATRIRILIEEVVDHTREETRHKTDALIKTFLDRVL